MNKVIWSKESIAARGDRRQEQLPTLSGRCGLV